MGNPPFHLHKDISPSALKKIGSKDGAPPSISVELDAQRDRYWANISNSNIRKANISDELVNAHEKLMLGGIWAIIEMEYDPMITIGATVFPFVVRDIKPIQLSTFDNSKISEKRKDVKIKLKYIFFITSPLKN